jgi:hypothetical protein
VTIYRPRNVLMRRMNSSTLLRFTTIVWQRTPALMCEPGSNGLVSLAQADVTGAVLSGSRAPGAGGSRTPGILGIGYSLRVRRVVGAGLRSALPLRFSVIFEYGGLIP